MKAMFYTQISSVAVWHTRDLQLSHNTLYLLSPRLCFVIVLNRNLFVYRDDSLSSQNLSSESNNQLTGLYHFRNRGRGWAR